MFNIFIWYYITTRMKRVTINIYLVPSSSKTHKHCSSKVFVKTFQWQLMSKLKERWYVFIKKTLSCIDVYVNCTLICNTYIGRGPASVMSTTWYGLRRRLKVVSNFWPWPPPLFAFTNTTKGVFPWGSNDSYKNRR